MFGPAFCQGIGILPTSTMHPLPRAKRMWCAEHGQQLLFFTNQSENSAPFAHLHPFVTFSGNFGLFRMNDVFVVAITTDLKPSRIKKASVQKLAPRLAASCQRLAG